MKHFLPSLFALAAICSIGWEMGYSDKITPNKTKWLDLRSNGILFGTTAGTDREESSKGKVTYYIRRADGTGKPEKLVSENGLFTFLLEPGVYEIYDWSMSGTKTEASKSRYAFEVRRGYLTYLGRLVTDLQKVESEEGKNRLENRPYLIDQTQFDATLFAELYPTLTDMDVIIAARDAFVWK